MDYSLDAKKESAMYKSLLRMLSKLKDDHLESGRFEDDVRMLYGYQGVFLATLDRLFIFLKKELLLLLRCETCERLISLYTWERNHRNPEEITYYLLNTSILLNEGPCFRFEFVQEGALIIHLLERGVQIALMEKLLRRWRTYVGLYFERQPGVDSKTTHAPFLKRNLRNAKAELSLGHKAFIQNNLQCRIAVNNLKIIFVTGTEDFMYRPLQARRQSASNPRKSPSVEQCNHRLEKMHRILALSDCSPEISHAVVPDIVDETMHDSSSVVVSSDPPCDDPLEMLGVD